MHGFSQRSGGSARVVGNPEVNYPATNEGADLNPNLLAAKPPPMKLGLTVLQPWPDIARKISSNILFSGQCAGC